MGVFPRLFEARERRTETSRSTWYSFGEIALYAIHSVLVSKIKVLRWRWRKEGEEEEVFILVEEIQDACVNNWNVRHPKNGVGLWLFCTSACVRSRKTQHESALVEGFGFCALVHTQRGHSDCWWTIFEEEREGRRHTSRISGGNLETLLFTVWILDFRQVPR
jgi:hypothetical protein